MGCCTTKETHGVDRFDLASQPNANPLQQQTPVLKSVDALPVWSPIGASSLSAQPASHAPVPSCRTNTAPEPVLGNSDYVSIWGSNPPEVAAVHDSTIPLDAIDHFIAMRRALALAEVAKESTELRVAQRHVASLGHSICKAPEASQRYIKPALEALRYLYTSHGGTAARAVGADLSRMRLRASQRSAERETIPASMSHPGMDEVIPGLFVGSWHAANDLQQLQLCGISNVVTLTGSKPFSDQGIRYLALTASDRETTSLRGVIPEALAFVKKRMFGRGNSVLIHCSAGCSRAPALAAAVIAETLRIHGIDALHVVERHRPCSCPNPGFQKQLANLSFGATKNGTTVKTVDSLSTSQ